MSRVLPTTRVFAAVLWLTLVGGPAPLSAATGEEVARPWQSEPSSLVGPESSPLAARARDFMSLYWKQVGGDSGQVLAFLGSIYAPTVSYYGKPTARETVLKDKSNFMRRWPIRRTWSSMTAESPRIFCDDGTAECEIRGVRDFETVSAERGARSVGVVYYWYRVRFADGSTQIIGENSEAVRYTGLP
jgi:hypothetical protein